MTVPNKQPPSFAATCDGLTTAWRRGKGTCLILSFCLPFPDFLIQASWFKSHRTTSQQLQQSSNRTFSNNTLLLFWPAASLLIWQQKVETWTEQTCFLVYSSRAAMAKAEPRLQIQIANLLQPNSITYLLFITLDFHWGKLVQVILCKCTVETNRWKTPLVRYTNPC